MSRGNPTPDEVREHLHAILASQSFLNAVRPTRFLTYVVTETLEGRTDAIKELVLGVEVFDRPADFDPKADTIVRVEAGKLRKRLAEYYANEGSSSPLRIDIPRGTYIPQFVPNPEPRSKPVIQPSLHRAQHAAPVAAAVLIVAIISAVAWWQLRYVPASAPRVVPSIAVLPFLNMSADPANEYFADGLSEELTDAMCKVDGLRVASRTSSFFFKGKSADIHEIGSRLHVAFALEGSVRKQGDQLKVTAQLIRTDDGYHVWSGSFERKLAGVFAVQSEIADSVVRVLEVKLTGTRLRRIATPHPASQRAFDLYLQGKHVLNSSAPGSLEQAEKLLQQSIAAAPDYAPTYVALAGVYGKANIYSGRYADELYVKGVTAINKALSLDSEMADAHAMRGTLLARYEHDWMGAERQLRHALQLNPNSSAAHYSLAQDVLAPQERWPEAMAENRLSSELDPLNSRTFYSEPWLAMLQRKHDVAIAGFRSASAAAPGDMFALGGLAIALSQKGNFDAALQVEREMQRTAPSAVNLSSIGYNEARRGNSAETRRILGQLQAQSKTQFVSPMCFAFVYLGLGDADNAFRYLEMGREQRDLSFMFFARAISVFDPVRHDPRFLALLSELGLSDAQILQYQQRQ